MDDREQILLAMHVVMAHHMRCVKALILEGEDAVRVIAGEALLTFMESMANNARHGFSSAIRQSATSILRQMEEPMSREQARQILCHATTPEALAATVALDECFKEGMEKGL